MKTTSEVLQRVSLFAGLAPEVLESLAERLKHIDLERGETLFREGEPGGSLYLVESGEVRVLSHGGRREIRRFGPGAHVGEMSLIDPAPRSATVIAGCDSRLWQLSSDDFDALCKAHPNVQKQVAIALARRLRDTTLGAAPPRAELVVFLIDARQPADGNDAVQRLVTALTHTTQRSVATVHVGTQPEHSPGASEAHAAAVEQPEALNARVDRLLHHYGHVLLVAEGATTDERLLRAACGRADVTIVLQTSEPDSLATVQLILQRIAAISLPDAPPVELAIDRREERPRRPFGPIDALAAGRPVHTIARTPGYRAAGAPDWDGFGRLARRIARRRVGLVMGGGGARAFAHVGVIGVFEKAGIPVDVLAGTSGGAIVAGLAARDWDSAQIAEFLLARWTRRGVVDWGLIPWVSLLRGRKLEMIGLDAGEGLTIQELTRPMVTVATDLVTGEAVRIRRGDGWTAVRASLSVPGVFPPVRVGDRYMVDGGAINNLPADAARECGADIVIGVNVSPPLEPAFLQAAKEQTRHGIFDRIRDWRLRGGLPLFRIIYRTITVQGQALQSRQGAPDFTIYPDVSGYDMFEFRTLRPIIERGRIEAEARVEEVKRIALHTGKSDSDLDRATISR
jgi:NTE family protein